MHWHVWLLEKAVLKMHTDSDTLFFITAAVGMFFMSFEAFGYTAYAPPPLKKKKIAGLIFSTFMYFPRNLKILLSP